MTTLSSPVAPPGTPLVALAAAPAVRWRRRGLYTSSRRLAGFELRVSSRSEASTSRALAAALGALPSSSCASSPCPSALPGPSAFPGPAGSRPGLPLLVDLTRSLAVGELPLPCACARVVLALRDDVALDADVLSGLAALRAAGHRVAVGGLGGAPWRMPALRHADLVLLDARVGDDLGGLVATARAHAPRAQLVGTGVDDEEALAACLALGVDLVQGRHLDGPGLPGAAAGLAGSQLACLRLLTALAREDVENHEIEQLVTTDVALSMRVLRAAGSSTAAPSRPVTSVRQAVLLLGRRELSSWVTLLLLGGASGRPVPDLAGVLARAGACARLSPAAPDVAFTVGLLSGVSSVLGMALDRLLATVGVASDVRAALLEHAGEAGRALGEVLAWEGGVAAPAEGAHSADDVAAACVAALAEVLADLDGPPD